MKYKIFINYRRKDTFGIAKSLHDQLSGIFGSKAVFLDTEDIEGGDNWVKILNSSGAYAKIVLILIGEKWLEKNEAGNYRIKDDGDWVRKEIKQAIDHKLSLIPILVNSTNMPASSDLPEDIQQLLQIQALNLRDTRFNDDVHHIAKTICSKLHHPIICSFLQYKKWVYAGLLFFAISVAAIYYFQKESPCPAFNTRSPLCVLFLPSNQMKKEGNYVLEEFYDKSQPNFNADIKKYGQVISDFTEYESVTRSCSADIFLAVRNAAVTNEFRFGFSNDSIRQYSYSNELNRKQTFTRLSDLINDREFHNNMDGLICFLASYISLSKGAQEVNDNFLRTCKVSDASPELQKIHYEMQADIFIQKQDFKKALEVIEAREKISPINDNLKAKKAEVAEKTKRFDIAANTYTELIKESNFSKEKLLEKRGDQYIELKDYPKAQKDYNEVIRKNPGNQQVDKKSKDVNVKISTIDRNLTNSLLNNNISEEMKIKHIEQAIQIGNYNLAEQIKSTLKTQTMQNTNFQKLDIELKLENGQLNSIETINPELLSNQRLINKLKDKKVINN